MRMPGLRVLVAESCPRGAPPAAAHSAAPLCLRFTRLRVRRHDAEQSQKARAHAHWGAALRLQLARLRPRVCDEQRPKRAQARARCAAPVCLRRARLRFCVLAERQSRGAQAHAHGRAPVRLRRAGLRLCVQPAQRAHGAPARAHGRAPLCLRRAGLFFLLQPEQRAQGAHAHTHCRAPLCLRGGRLRVHVRAEQPSEEARDDGARWGRPRACDAAPGCRRARMALSSEQRAQFAGGGRDSSCSCFGAPLSAVFRARWRALGSAVLYAAAPHFKSWQVCAPPRDHVLPAYYLAHTVSRPVTG
jgi:hypothetical protein